MHYFSVFFIFTAILLAISFLAIAAKQKDRIHRVAYFFWGLGFFFASGWDIFYLLSGYGILTKQIAEFSSILSWLVFLVLMYCGTIFIFTKRIFCNLTYLLFLPAVLLLLFSPLFFSQPASLAILGGFFVIIPLQIVLGTLSWFLGLSFLKDLAALFAYWTIGAAWFLHSVEVGLSSVLLFTGKDQALNLYEQPTVRYIGTVAEVLLIAGFIALFIRRQMHRKECF